MRVFLSIIIICIIFIGCEDNTQAPENNPIDDYIKSISFLSNVLVENLTDPLVITFNRPMDTASVRIAFSSEPSFDYNVLWTAEQYEQNNETSPVKYSHKMYLYPKTSFRSEAKYNCTLDTTAIDTLGNQLPRQYKFEFKTDRARLVRFEVNSPNVIGALDYPREIILQFNVPINSGRMIDPFLTEPNIDYGGMLVSDDQTQYIYPLESDLRAETDYKITIAGGVIDMWDNFVYGQDPLIIQTEPVQVSYHYPNSGSNIKGSSVIMQIRFNTAMNQSTAEAAFSVGDGIVEVGGRFEWISDQAFLYYPDSVLQIHNQYTMKVDTTAKDIFGDNLKNAFNYKFLVTP